MARGRKISLTLEKQLERITIEIENTKNNLKEMEQEKKNLEEQIRNNHLMELDELITQSGKSIEEIMEMIGNGENDIKEEVA